MHPIQSWARATALALAVLFTACAPLMSAIAIIAPLVADAIMVVDTIHDYVDAQDAIPVNVKGGIHAAVDRARSAFQAVEAAARVAQSLDDQDLNAALAEARRAYDALLELTKPFGVKQSKLGMFGAVPGDTGLIVPDFEQLEKRAGWR